MPALCDCFVPHPRILFVGINPGLRSGAIGHHFAGPGNPWWRLLHASGLVSEVLPAEQDSRLTEWRLGLTNLCPRPTRSAAELGAAEIAAGRRALARKIARLQPCVVAFVGLTLYQHFFGHKASGGAGEKPERIGNSRVFVLPNPSGLNASFPGFREKLVWFERLREFVERLEREDEECARKGKK